MHPLFSYESDAIQYLSLIDALKDQHGFAWCYSDLPSMLDAERLGSPITPEEWAECAVEDLVEQTDKIAEALNSWKALDAAERTAFLATAYLNNGTVGLLRQQWMTIKPQVSCLRLGDSVLLYGITQERPIELWESWELAWIKFLQKTGLPSPTDLPLRFRRSVT